MPTSEEFQTLYEATKWTRKDSGYYVTKLGENLVDDNSNALLFFPIAGSGNAGNLGGAGTSGGYWSSTLYSDDDTQAYRLSTSNSKVDPQSKIYRARGLSVRPVSD